MGAHNLQRQNPRGQVVMNAVTGKINSYGEEIKDFVKLCLTERPWRRHPNSRWANCALLWLCISPSNWADGRKSGRPKL